MDSKKKIAIIMLGAPGSGKGTQGKLLEDKTGFKRYVMSDLIKKELTPGTLLYKQVFKEGILLNDSHVFEIFRKYFKSESDIILDGIPRTLDQAYWLYGFLKNHYYTIKLIFLNVDETQLISRITSRYYCPKCHRLYNSQLKELMPKIEGVCDDDGEILIQRDDDTSQIFNERLEIFNTVKEIILNVYKAEILEVNGDEDIETVSKEIIRKIILYK
ncbi:MAG: nucleoside monophosphate kinase [Nanoarchaeota archaeon]|nr:nucleoside monophosphate kinase [Nanoarchaeota archaeon]